MSKIFPATLVLLAVSSLCHARAQDPYGRLPLSFELNQGQADAAVNFLARGPGYGLFLTPGEAVLSLHSPTAAAEAASSSTVISVALAGANTHAHASGTDTLPGVTNYFVGGDRTAWHTHIPNYAKVKYMGVYPGVDLVYYGNQQQLEYDFVVAPGANPNVIALDFKGVKSLKVDAAGDLVLNTGDGELVQQNPVIYQFIDGERRQVSGSYVLEGKRARFELGRYDHTQPLVIDPVLGYATYLGGNDFDNGNSIAVDANGDAYVTGLVYSGDFPVGRGAGCKTRGNGAAFVVKLNRSGSQFVYATYLGGSAQDAGNGIAVDPRGNAYVTGYTRSNDFPTTRGALQPRLGSGAIENAFVARLDTFGTLTYSTYLGGTSSDVGRGIAVDANDNAYVTGYTRSSNFPTTGRVAQKNLAGLQNAFVAKLNANGSALQYSTFLGGNDYDFGFGIAVNKQGNAYVTGTTYSVFANTFPTTSNAFQTTAGGSGDAFVTKLSPDGSALVYSTFLGGSGYDGGRGIAVDTTGNAYVTGYTTSNAFAITPGAYQTTLEGTEDAFVTKLNPDGTALVYSSYLGGSANDAGYGIAVASNGNTYVTGYTQSPDFPTSNGAVQTVSNGGSRVAFVAALDSTGAKLSYSTYLGGSNGDTSYGIALDSSSNAYVTGYTNSSDFPTTADAAQSQLGQGASQNAFIVKIAAASQP